MIKNKLLKYSNKAIEITEGLFLHNIMVSEIITMGEEWLSQILLPFKLTKEHLSFNIIDEESMGGITKEYDSFREVENNLTDEILGSLDAEQRQILYDTRKKYKFVRFNNITEDELEDMTLLEAYFRSYILEKYVGGNDRILEKVIESLKYLLKVDNIEIDEDNMVLIVKDVVIKGKNLNDENCADIIKDVVINSDVFDEICEWVLLLNYTEKSIVEPPLKFKDEKTRIAWEKKEARDKKAMDKKNNSQIDYYFGYVVHKLNSDYDRVLEFTMYQLLDTYTSLMDKEALENNLFIRSYADSEGSSKIDTEHWLTKRQDRNK